MNAKQELALRGRIGETISQLLDAKDAVDALLKDPDFTRKYRNLGLRRDLTGGSWCIENLLVVLDCHSEHTGPSVRACRPAKS